jgi:hypothetical protein
MLLRKVYPPVAPENRPVLRAVRAVTPGAPDKPKAKQTSAQVLEDKHCVNEEKKKKLLEREAAILSVSDKENEMARADEAADLFADHPPPNAKKKAVRTRLPAEKTGEFSALLTPSKCRFLTSNSRKAVECGERRSESRRSIHGG